jgi:DNA-binding transcriptional ArsR family regulator
MSIIIAAVGEDMNDLFIAVREFTVEKVILINYAGREEKLKKTKKELKKFNVPAEVVEIEGNVWEETFRIVHVIKKANDGKELLINVSTGDKTTRCAMTSAAFVNGLKAFSVSDGVIAMLPVLKFSYYRLITDRKMKILETLQENPDCCASLEELSKRCEMSLPLVSYHINGNPKSEGLKEMGLVETKEEKGRIRVELSLMGKILMKGYIDEPPQKNK